MGTRFEPIVQRPALPWWATALIAGPLFGVILSVGDFVCLALAWFNVLQVDAAPTLAIWSLVVLCATGGIVAFGSGR